MVLGHSEFHPEGTCTPFLTVKWAKLHFTNEGVIKRNGVADQIGEINLSAPIPIEESRQEFGLAILLLQSKID